jgi:bifunctional ADP-heptose synthase (sugar kinase/adenylyltransferase)
MDTRSKIVPVEQAEQIAAEGATVVSGFFDPVLASHAERLADLKPGGAKLLVLIAEPDEPILPARARAELVAGLRIVDYVCESADGIAAGTSLEAEDRRRFVDLVARVQARQTTS